MCTDTGRIKRNCQGNKKRRIKQLVLNGVFNNIEKLPSKGDIRNPQTAFFHHREHREKTFLPSLCSLCPLWFI
jgi:hypothetical protein